MGNVGRQAREAPCIGIHHANARREELFPHFAHALVAALGINVDEFDRCGIKLQTRRNGVKARENNRSRLKLLAFRTALRAIDALVVSAFLPHWRHPILKSKKPS